MRANPLPFSVGYCIVESSLTRIYAILWSILEKSEPYINQNLMTLENKFVYKAARGEKRDEVNKDESKFV